MRKLWFGLSLAVVFVFAASASYIYFVLAEGAPEVDKPYKAATEITARSPQVAADMRVTRREVYACGYTAEEVLDNGGEFRGLTFDQLAGDGWNVAQTGEKSLEITRQVADMCPIEQEKRLIVDSGRGLAVYRGTAAHRGDLLLEMPVDMSELPPELTEALAAGGYQLESQAELDELLESLDELIAAPGEE